MAKSFGETLRDLRRSKEISQRELAEKVGVDFSYISKVENDRLPPPAADTIVRICGVLMVEAHDLLVLTKKMPTDVREMLSGSSSAQQFVRQAQQMNLTNKEWEVLTKRLKRLRS